MKTQTTEQNLDMFAAMMPSQSEIKAREKNAKAIESELAKRFQHNAPTKRRSYRKKDIVSMFEKQPSDFPLPSREDVKEYRARKTRYYEQWYQRMLDVLQTPESLTEAPDDWSEEAVRELKVFMLERHLAYLLDGRTNMETVVEAWDWIMSDADYPFSFKHCLQVYAEETSFADREVTSIDANEVRQCLHDMAHFAKRPTYDQAQAELEGWIQQKELGGTFAQDLVDSLYVLAETGEIL